MAIKGKILGAIIGGLTGGPIGAVIGLATGHAIDSLSGADNFPANNTIGNKNILEPIFSAIAKVAKADGTVSDAEIAEVEQIFRELNLDYETRNYAIKCFRNAKDSDESIENIAMRFARTANAELRKSFFIILMRVALADKQMYEGEREVLLKVARILGIDINDFSEYFPDEFHSGRQKQNSEYQKQSGKSYANSRSISSELAESYAVLGVPSSASDEEIKKMYRSKCKDFHPDVLGSKGIGEHAMQILENELRKINQAYEIISKHRNMK